MSLLRSLESPQHARLRFNSTVVMTEDHQPIYITNVDDYWHVNAVMLDSGDAVTLSDIRTKIVPDPVSLGFVQIGKNAHYLSRRPSRRTKQGLDLSDVSTYSLGDELFEMHSRSVLKAIGKTILGEYASFEAAVKSIKKTAKSLAFHRDWALEKRDDEIYVVYKFFGRCGTIEGGLVRLSNDFLYLKETLEEDVGNVHS